MEGRVRRQVVEQKSDERSVGVTTCMTYLQSKPMKLPVSLVLGYDRLSRVTDLTAYRSGHRVKLGVTSR